MQHGRRPDEEIPAAGPGRRRDTWLWILPLAGPTIWFAHLWFSFLLVPPLCDAGIRWPLHLLSAAALATTIAAGIGVSWILRRLPSRGDRDDSWAMGRARFMARLGIASSVLFTAVIAAATIPTAVLGCGTP